MKQYFLVLISSILLASCAASTLGSSGTGNLLAYESGNPTKLCKFTLRQGSRALESGELTQQQGELALGVVARDLSRNSRKVHALAVGTRKLLTQVVTDEIESLQIGVDISEKCVFHSSILRVLEVANSLWLYESRSTFKVGLKVGNEKHTSFGPSFFRNS